jgi:hypothetical protein
MATSNPLNLIVRYWQIIAAVVVISAGAATAQSQIASQGIEIHRIDASGTAYSHTQGEEIRERLATIEQTQRDNKELLNHVAAQVDRISERVR